MFPLTLTAFFLISAQTTNDTSPVLLKPARVYDGIAAQPHEGWVVLVRGRRIEKVGPAADVAVPRDARRIELAGMTLLPGLIDAHTHLLLHPYNETSWDDQVLKEPLRALSLPGEQSARNTLLAGFTTIRDLGTEGAGYADVGIKQAINQAIIPGPRMLVVTRAIVATGAFTREFAPEVRVHQGRGRGRRRHPAARRPRPDPPGRRLDQGLRRLPVGTRERGQARSPWRS